MAHCSRRSRLSKPVVASSRQPGQVARPSGPSVVEAADVAPVEVNASAPVKVGPATPAGTNTFAPIKAGIAAPEVVSHAEPEATAETPMHPYDVDLGIPPQEESSAFVRTLTSSHS